MAFCNELTSRHDWLDVTTFGDFMLTEICLKCRATRRRPLPAPEMRARKTAALQSGN